MDQNNQLESEIKANNELNVEKVIVDDKKKWLWHPIEKLSKLGLINKH